MNRRIGTILLTALAASMLLSPATPTNVALQPQNTVAATQNSGPAQETPPSWTEQSPRTLEANKAVANKCTVDCQDQELLDVIQSFYGTDNTASQDSLSHLGVPSAERGKIGYLIALVPDPVHTHLSLFFDRTIEAIEQGALQEHYILARSVMPCHYEIKNRPA